MTLRNAVQRLSAASSCFQVTPFSFPPRLAKTNRVLEKNFVTGGELPPVESLSVVARHIVEVVHAGQWHGVSKREWRQAAWCLWLKDTPLAHTPTVLDAYLGWLRHDNRMSAYKRLISAYLRDFNKTDASFHKVADVLSGIAAEFDWPWREKHRQFRLFSAEHGPHSVAVAVMSSDLPVHDALDEVGLVGDLAYQGFGAESFKIALGLYKANPSEHSLDRILKWSCLYGEFRFGALRDVIANNLLLPWASGNRNAAQSVADVTRDFLLSHYKDPRLHSGYWNGVNEDAKTVMYRWLAKASLEQFLQIVDNIASPELRTQWPYRRAFWEAYERKGFIEEAWVAFADKGARRARSMFKGELKFGQLHSSGVQQNHAVLMLKLSGLTIAEWSENGKCHVWLSGNKAAPKLYQSEYIKWELLDRSDNGGVAHVVSDRGTWQGKVEGFIRGNTGIQLKQSDYMPRRGR